MFCCAQALTPRQRTLVWIGAFTLFPIRLVVLIVLLLLSALVSMLVTLGVPPAKLAREALSPFRQNLVASVRFICGLWLNACGFRRFRVKGKRVGFQEAPIIVANHIGLFESLLLMTTAPVRPGLY